MKHLLLSILILIGLTSISQITYTSANHASGAYSQQMTNVTVGINGFNFASTGANFSWNYATLGKDSWGNKSTVTAAASGYQAPYIAQCIANGGGFTCLFNWNNLTNMGILETDSMNAFVVTLYDVMTMAKKTTNHLVGTVKGLRIKDSTGITIPLVTEYTDQDTIFNFPLNYQDSGTSKGAWGYDLNSLGQNIVYKASYTRNYQIEGWGSLVTPHATYANTLKIKTVIDQIDSVDFLGTPFGLPRKIVEYTWLDAAFGLPVMKAEGIEVLGTTTINSVSYIDNVYVGIEENKLTTFNLYPNPSSDLITVINKENNRIESYKILDLQGRFVQENSFTKSISVAELEPGTYIIQLFSDNEIVGIEKFVKE
ncbi:MAG: T9SS type A sorting domain-containing protein [Flavobacteriales bacterium]